MNEDLLPLKIKMFFIHVVNKGNAGNKNQCCINIGLLKGAIVISFPIPPFERKIGAPIFG